MRLTVVPQGENGRGGWGCRGIVAKGVQRVKCKCSRCVEQYHGTIYDGTWEGSKREPAREHMADVCRLARLLRALL